MTTLSVLEGHFFLLQAFSSAIFLYLWRVTRCLCICRASCTITTTSNTFYHLWCADHREQWSVWQELYSDNVAKRLPMPCIRSLQGCSLKWTALDANVSCLLTYTYIHTYTFNGLFSTTTWISWHQKGKPFWILLKQEMLSSSGISWTICKLFAPHSRQITTSVPHDSFLRAGCSSWRPTNSVCLNAFIRTSLLWPL